MHHVKLVTDILYLFFNHITIENGGKGKPI